MTKPTEATKTKTAALTKDECAVVQAAAMMLCRAIINEEVGIQVFRDLKTGQPCAVIGREVRKLAEGNKVYLSFTPLARVFQSAPHLEVEPWDKPTATLEAEVRIMVDQGGKVMNVDVNGPSDEEVFAHAVPVPTDPTKAN